MIIGEIRRYLRDNSTVRVSRSVRDLAYKAIGARDRLARSLGREPEEDEIVKALGEEQIVCTRGEVSEALTAISDPVSLFEPVFGEGGDAVCVMDMISDPSGGDDAWLENIALGEAVRKLSERERNIIRLRFYNGRTQMEIADEIGLLHNEMKEPKALCLSAAIDFPRRLSGHRGERTVTYDVTAVISAG